jgi:DNA-binding NtrC family response regulator
MLASLGALDRPEAAEMRTPPFVNELMRHAWPGNVRELRNYVERCLALRQRLPIVDEAPAGDSDDDGPIDVSVPLSVARTEHIRRFERRYLQELLRRHDNNVTAAAKAAGLERSHVYRLLWRSGLR